MNLGALLREAQGTRRTSISALRDKQHPASGNNTPTSRQDSRNDRVAAARRCPAIAGDSCPPHRSSASQESPPGSSMRIRPRRPTPSALVRESSLPPKNSALITPSGGAVCVISISRRKHKSRKSQQQKQSQSGPCRSCTPTTTNDWDANFGIPCAPKTHFVTNSVNCEISHILQILYIDTNGFRYCDNLF